MKTPILKHLCLAFAVLGLTTNAHAILMSFDNVSFDSADLTVDWSDGTSIFGPRTLDQDFWHAATDRLAAPNNWVNILCVPAFWRVDHGGWPEVLAKLFFEGTFPEAGVLTGYTIEDSFIAEFVRGVSQTPNSITFHIAGPSAQVPDSGSTIGLLALAAGVIGGLHGLARFRGQGLCG